MFIHHFVNFIFYEIKTLTKRSYSHFSWTVFFFRRKFWNNLSKIDESTIFWEGRRISLLIRRIFLRMYIKRFGTLYKWLFADYRNSFSSGGYERLLQPVPYFFAYHNAVHGVFRTLVSHRISLFLLVPSVVGLARHAQFLRPTIYNRPSTGGDPGATNTFLVLSIWLLAVITPRIVPEILNFLPNFINRRFLSERPSITQKKIEFFCNLLYLLCDRYTTMVFYASLSAMIHKRSNR